MTVAELFGHIPYIVRDPRSWLHAELAGWDRPASFEWLALADLIDVQMFSKSKRRPKPYKRPFSNSRRIGGKNKVRRDQNEVRALLR